MLRKIAENLWVTERPLRFFGLEIGTRMTVVRLASGALVCHSPVEPDPVLRQELDALGEVRFVICPNRFHHRFALPYRSYYPGVEIFVAPGLESKRSDLKADGVLHDAPDLRWAPELDQHCVRGMPMLNEVTFLHRTSRTLLLTDLAFHLGPSAPPMTRRVIGWMGGKGFGPTWELRFGALRDRGEARRSIEQLLAWDFDRVIVAHGDILETGGRAALAEGYRWLLRPGESGVG